MTIKDYDYKILIVDDSAEDRLTYRRFLSKNSLINYQIIEAETGDEGLEHLKNNTPDLILLDYLLPDFDGLEFIDYLKSKFETIPPIIMLTGQGNESVAVDAMKSGVKDYLIKGNLTADALAIKVKSVLQQERWQSLLNKNYQQQKLIAETALRIRQTTNFETTLNTAVAEIQTILDCDRVIIYKFDPDMLGQVVAESVKEGWTASLGANIVDTCFREKGAVRYQKWETLAISNIYGSDLSACHIDLLEKYQVKANAIAPILIATSSVKRKSRLWGLLIAHQCSGFRNWEQDEIELLDKLGVQLAIAIKQAELTSNLQQKAQELAKTNQKLRQTTNLLQKRNQELDNFAYVTSHDLKAPLRAISNLATWLEEDLGQEIPEENQEQLSLMRSRVSRMENLIQGLLDYSRVGRKHLPAQEINVAELIAETIDSLDPPPGFAIAVEVQIPTLKTETLLLQQVFSNLIGNAIKYHPQDKGNIRVSVEEQAEFYQFAVADDGMGIEPKYHDRIFNIFQTLQARDKFESTGIGLSIVKKIVEEQGGTIWLESQLGEGATFYFTWSK